MLAENPKTHITFKIQNKNLEEFFEYFNFELDHSGLEKQIWGFPVMRYVPFKNIHNEHNIVCLNLHISNTSSYLIGPASQKILPIDLYLTLLALKRLEYSVELCIDEEHDATSGKSQYNSIHNDPVKDSFDYIEIHLSNTASTMEQFVFLCDIMLILTSPTLLPWLYNNHRNTSFKLKSFGEFKRYLLNKRRHELLFNHKRSHHCKSDDAINMIIGEEYCCIATDLVEGRKETLYLKSLFEKDIGCAEETKYHYLTQLTNITPNTEIVPHLHMDYGFNIYFHKQSYANAGCIFLDCNLISIKQRSMLGPGVHIYTTNHPTNPVERGTFVETTSLVEIGHDCWIGGNVTILPGVRIGNGCTIGAGSLVTKDIPPGSIAMGNPAVVKKKVNYSIQDLYKLTKD